MFPDRFGGNECLQAVKSGVIDEILERMEVEKSPLTDWGIPAHFIPEAEKAAALLNIKVNKVPLENVWPIFAALLSLLGV
jgi:hypothetical protein